MTTTGMKSFDSSVQTTNEWLGEIARELGWEDRHKAYHAMRAVLHALRDRLPVENVAHLASQLPMLVRGFYYEGWQPSAATTRDHTQNEFLVHVTEAFLLDPDAQSKEIAEAVFRVLARHISAGEVDKVKSTLPKGIRELWS